jgi:hypothetical protein
MDLSMILLIYLASAGAVFLCTYAILPGLLKMIMRWLMGTVSAELGHRFTSDIRQRLAEASTGVLDDLKYQVVLHLVEPWLGKLVERCADHLSGYGRPLMEKYCTHLVDVVLTRRAAIAAVVSQLLVGPVVLGVYLGKAF